MTTSSHAAGTLLVGISNPDTADHLVRLSGGLGKATGFDVLLTHVVPVANQIALGTGSSSPEVIHGRDLLQAASASAADVGMDVRAVVEVARSVEDGLLAAADSHDASMILVGYSGEDPTSDAEDRFDRTMHRVARKARADVVIAKLRSASHRSVLVPLAADAPLRLTGLLCRALAADLGASLRYLHVTAEGDPPEAARGPLQARLEREGLPDRTAVDVVASDDAVGAIVAAADDHDLVLLGPSGRPGLLDALFSSRARKIAESVSSSVLLAWSLADEA